MPQMAFYFYEMEIMTKVVFQANLCLPSPRRIFMISWYDFCSASRGLDTDTFLTLNRQSLVENIFQKSRFVPLGGIRK